MSVSKGSYEGGVKGVGEGKYQEHAKDRSDETREVESPLAPEDVGDDAERESTDTKNADGN